MIAVDTNILLRYLVEDDPAQLRAAQAFIEGELTETEPGFISLIVVCELAWALSQTYKHPREAIARAIGALAEATHFEFGSPDVLARALAAPNGDIAAALIHEIGKARGCARTVTFDRRFARHPGVELLSA